MDEPSAHPHAVLVARAGRSSWRGAGVIALAYLGVSLVWIVGSDWLARQLASAFSESLADSLAANARFQTVKGSFFVLATAVLLWALIARHFRSLEVVNGRLGESELRLRRLLESAPVAICVLRGGVPEFINAAATAMLGSGALGRPILDFAGADSRAALEAAVRGAATDQSVRTLPEVQIVAADGRELTVEVSCTQFAPDAGRVLVVMVDVTERKKLESVIRQAQKVDAAGSIAALVTHEFNNVLTAILGQTAIARSAMRGNPDADRALSEIESVGRDAAGLTRSLPLLQRQSPSIKTSVSVGEILRGAESQIRGILPPGIRFSMDVGAVNGAHCEADAAQFRQALINLAVNARDAMPDGGELRITAAADDGREAARPRVVIRVADSGRGIPAEHLPHVFTPFYSTKAPSRGTGLGLAVARGIVEDHGGSIAVESAPGRGAVFTIAIPASLPPPSAAARAPAANPVMSDRLIVVGEDNPQVRHVFVEVLRRSGRRVEACADGESVLRTVAEAGPRVVAVVLDVGLPGLSGVECLERLRRVWPELPCILTTGGPRPELAPHLVDHTGFLAKPFSVDELIDTVDAMVGAGDEGTRQDATPKG